MRSIIFLLCLLPAAAFGQVKNSIEAAEYDPDNNRYFVSNGSSVLVTEDGGDTWEFFGDAAASHGMEVLNNTLYVISGTQLKGYDLASAEEVMTLSIPGVQFLNGMGNDGDHRLFVTDFNGSKIYEVDVTDNANPLYTEIISNTASTPNGLTVDLANNRAVFVNWYGNSDIKAFDLDDYTMSTVLNNSGLGNCDGIDIDNDGNFYVSSWSPQQITKFNNDFSVSEVITAPGLSNPADISYALETDTLAIANSGSDEVTFIYLGLVDDVEGIKNTNWTLNVYPNPVTPSSSVLLEMKIAAQVRLDVVALDGRIVAHLVNGHMNRGNQRVLFTGLDMTTGQYFLQGTIAGQPVSYPFVVR
jgi:sugar lactone lactonase YvrE